MNEDRIYDQSYLNQIPKEFQVYGYELFILGQNIDMGLMKGYLDGDPTVQYVNDKALEYLGYTRKEFKEVFNNSIVAFTHPDDASIVQANAAQLIESGEPLEFQTRAIRKDGKIISLKGRSSCAKDAMGRPIGLYAFRDVTEEIERDLAMQRSFEDKIIELEKLIVAERESREALRISEERYKLIVDMSDDIVFEYDFKSGKFEIPDKYEKVLGWSLLNNNSCGQTEMRNRIHPKDILIYDDWIKRLYCDKGNIIAEFRHTKADGNYIWIKSTSIVITDKNGDKLKAVGVFANINKQKEEITELYKKSKLDQLTLIYNKEESRKLIEEYLNSKAEEKSAFFIVDIDNFKGVNDNLGHQFGDSVLQQVADKIRRQFRNYDIVGRLGGDEMIILMKGFESNEMLLNRCAKLVKTLRSTYQGMNGKYNISASIGVSCYPSDGQTFKELYKYADIALYESKNRGKDCFTLYKENMVSSLEGNLTPVDGTERFLNTYYAGDTIYNVFQMLYETKDIKATIQNVLEFLCEKFEADRIYIFEHSDDGLHTSETYEWCALDDLTVKDRLQNIPLKDYDSVFKSYNAEGILICSNIKDLKFGSYNSFLEKDIKSFLHCAIFNESDIAGVIGMDSFKERQWNDDEIAVLGYISRILSVFLIKSKMTKKLIESYERHSEIIGNLNGFVYVIDRETYEILYLNHAAKSLGLNLGEKCYYAAFGNDYPCENCPANKLTAEKPFTTEEIYSEKLDCWVISAASKLKWGGHRDTALICCTDISKYKK